jgi:hypothetical protein
VKAPITNWKSTAVDGENEAGAPSCAIMLRFTASVTAPDVIRTCVWGTLTWTDS